MARHAFWVIVDGETPTSFRSRQREDLLPTLTQLKRTQPNVALMWFERGRLWPSVEEARAALAARRQAPMRRPREWRPGGDHVDPRARYDVPRDQRRARFKARLDRDRRGAHAPAAPNAPTRAGQPPRPPSRHDRPRDQGKPGRGRGTASTGTASTAENREKDRKPTGFGDRPWRPKKPWQPGRPWRPGKPRGGKG